MLITATYFWQVVLAVHIATVVTAFGILVSYPLIAMTAERLDRRVVPVLLRLRVILGRALINPGLLLVVLAGVYLAAHLHQWHEFYVQWGIGAAIVIGALEGSFAIRWSNRLAKSAHRDVEAAGLGEVTWSDEYLALRGRTDVVNATMAVIVLVTVYLMAVQ